MKAPALAVLGLVAGCAAHDLQRQPPAASAKDTVAFTDHASPVILLDPPAIKARAAPRELSVGEPHHDQPVRYSAVSLKALLDSVYGPKWQKAAVVIFKGADGFEAGVPVERLTALHADLAFAFADGSPFTTHDHKHGDALIPLGPWRLIWEDAPLDAPREGAMWPYQVIAIDLEDAPQQ